MPTYTYSCPNCGEFEVQQSIIEPAQRACPICGATVKRVITGGSGFVLKGRGAYRDRCEREIPCCGREVRCDKPPCAK